MSNSIIARDLRHIWHPCSQMHDYKTLKPLVITGARGPYLAQAHGPKIIDAISSWWCKSLGHNHPRLKQALIKQAHKYEHIIGANTCQRPLVELSERLATLTPNLDKVFYASEGSAAVEIALKMSLHSRLNSNEKQRTHIMALQNSYHGETILALAVSDVGIYRKPYEQFLPRIITPFLQNIPYVNSSHDQLWNNATAIWPTIEKQLNKYAATLSAIIVEPIVQGAGGMLIYSQDFLRHLRAWTIKHNVHLIADEIMTGFGRTGTAVACQHAAITPDFICLGKGLTAGWLPMSAVLTSTKIYRLFYGDYARHKSFLHSHTFSGNALAAAIALENLKILADENIYHQAREKENLLFELMQGVAEKTSRLTNIRGIGALVAADLIITSKNKNKRLGYEIFRAALKLGAFLRPLGNTIYWLPPLNCKKSVLYKLQKITIQALLTLS